MATLVLKEEIPALRLVPAFVDKTIQWLDQLRYAVRLGNEFKGKSVITFETSQGPRRVETTVWSLTDHYLTLKGGTAIPLNSVTDVHF